MRFIINVLMLCLITEIPISRAAFPVTQVPSAQVSKELTIYHIEGRRSQRVVWLCEEIGFPYKLVFKRGDVLGSLTTIREVNPLMPVAPTIRYGDLMMVESGAILELLLAQHGQGKLAPTVTSPDYPYYLMWLHFAEGSGMAHLTADRLRMRLVGEKTMTRQLIPGRNFGLVGTFEVLSFMEDFLGKHPYFGGREFSAADIMMHIVAITAATIPGVDMATYPHLVAWRRTVESRPAFLRATSAALPDGGSPDGLGIQGPMR